MRRRALLGGDDYEAVDLGVISGGKKLLWATMNVGAPSESTHGNYYQYGKGSRTYEQTSGETYYQGQEKPLASSADTATQVMGEDWRMPTNEECFRLTANTTYEWRAINGVNGGKFTSKTDSSKYIFLPASGIWQYGIKDDVGSNGYYLTSSKSDSAYLELSCLFEFSSSYASFTDSQRMYGCSVRGVKEVPLDESDLNGHQFVDLGLPSGTLWATMNVGASSPTDYGNYYQYGKGSRTYRQTSGETYYQGTENPLALTADTAHQVWGGAWHMPTQTQLNELIAYTLYEWTTINGVNGGKFTSLTDSSKYIFLPAGGSWDDSTHYAFGTIGRYWSSTSYNNNMYSAYYLNLNQKSQSIQSDSRLHGLSVRPVIG